MRGREDDRGRAWGCCCVPSVVGLWGMTLPTPPPPCENNTKAPKFDGSHTRCCSGRGVVLAMGGGGVTFELSGCGDDSPPPVF